MTTRADGRPRRKSGQRLTDPHDPAVQDALTRTCPLCHAAPHIWCGIETDGPTKGKRTNRIHNARCTFQYDADVKAATRP